MLKKCMSALITSALLILSCCQGETFYTCKTLIHLQLSIDAAALGCTSGFMQLDLLKRRAVKISNGMNTVSGNQLSDRGRVMPGLSFNCSGSITHLMLAADVRTVANDRDNYPELQIWRQAGSSSFITRRARAAITLSEGSFSSNGVLQYNLSSFMPFESGDVLGVYQPSQDDSVVQLFYAIDSNAPFAYERNRNRRRTSDSLSATVTNQHMLLLPVTGMYYFMSTYSIYIF